MIHFISRPKSIKKVGFNFFSVIYAFHLEFLPILNNTEYNPPSRSIRKRTYTLPNIFRKFSTCTLYLKVFPLNILKPT